MEIGYYPGCLLRDSSREYDESSRALLRRLGVTLKEVPDWTCCGAYSAEVMDARLALALPLRVLALAEQAGISQLLVPCATCCHRLQSAKRALEKHPENLASLENAMKMPWRGTVQVVGMLAFLGGMQDRIRDSVKIPFRKRVASYYGCKLVRPSEVTGLERFEDPMSMDRLVEAAGGVALDWSFKTECCGAAFTMTDPDLVGRQCGRLLHDAARRGAEILAVACPTCHANLEWRRDEANLAMGQECDLPVVFITQILGIALGLDHRKLGLHRHLIPVLS